MVAPCATSCSAACAARRLLAFASVVTPTPEMTVPASDAGTVLEFDSATTHVAAELRPLFLLGCFLLGLLLCLRHVGSPIDGLVRGPSIYTRSEITSEHHRGVLGKVRE